MRYKKDCVLQGFLRILKCDAAKREKCKNAVFFKGGVGNARRADRHNRHFVGRGPPDALICLTYPQHRPKIASKMAQHRANIGQHGANIRQHRPNLGQHRPTWPNTTTLRRLNHGRHPAVRRKPLNPGAGARALPGGPSVVTEGYLRAYARQPARGVEVGAGGWKIGRGCRLREWMLGGLGAMLRTAWV